MSKHYRRRRLLKALNDLYLDNWKTAATYADQQRTIRCLETVGQTMRKDYDRQQQQQQQQQLRLEL